MALFEKRRKNRQVDPNATRSKSRPGRTVGEDNGFVQTFAGLVGVICVAFAAMTWFSYRVSSDDGPQAGINGDDENSTTSVERQPKPESTALPSDPTAPQQKADEVPAMPASASEDVAASRAAERTPTPKKEEGTHTNLMSLIDLRRDVIKGQWRADAGTFVSGNDGGSLALPVEVPKHFELNLRVKRLHGRKGFSIGIVRNDISVLLVVDHYEGSGFEKIDGKRRGDAGAFIKQKQLEIGRETDLTMRIDGRSLVCLINAKRIIDWKGDYRRLSKSGNQDAWGSPHGKLCLYASDSDFQISSIILRTLESE